MSTVTDFADMQRFPTSAATYSYDPHHKPIGTVEAGETLEVECVEGFGNQFSAPDDFTPERYAVAEALKWAVTGPIDVVGAEAGGAVAVTIHSVVPTTPGVVVYGSYTAEDPSAWWDEETACAVYDVADGVVAFDERTTLETRPLIGCLAARPESEAFHARLQGRYGGNLDCKEIRPGATVVLPVGHDGAGLYFGDCKALMGAGEIVGPPEIGALVVATAEPRPRPAAMNWPRIETSESFTTLVSGKPLEWSARQAYRELLEWVLEDYDIPRPRAALLMAMVADAGICQISNDDYTAYCVTPRDVWETYRG
jgi:acetamidase/formamidase